MSRIVARCAAGALCLGLAACSGSSQQSTPPVDPSGDWQTTMTETSDACNRNNPSVQQSATRITRSGSSIKLQAEGETCDPGTATWDAGLQAYHFVYQDTTQYLAFDGCTYNEGRSIDLVINESLISGTDDIYYSWVSGTSCTFLPQQSCGIVIRVEGVRCQGCYTGCVASATAASSLPSHRGPAGGGALPLPSR